MKTIKKIKSKLLQMKGHAFKISRDLCYEIAILASAHYLYYHFF